MASCWPAVCACTLGFFAQTGASDALPLALPVPFAQAALWAAELPALRLCDLGVDDRQEGCPAQPEHGGAGFLSTVFTWRYVLNNLRALLAAEAPGSSSLPSGAAQAILSLLQAFDRLMQMPIVAQLADIAIAARQLLTDLRPHLQARPPVVLMVPTRPHFGRYWTWPADGRTSLRDAAFTLRTGAQMPAIGFGTWRLWAKDAYQPVRWALEVGYRHIDTAEGYANEAEIGRAILDSGVPRGEIFLATKASSVPKGLADISYASDIFTFQLAQLGTDYVDLYMMHTPPSDPQLLQQVWRIMESFYEQGRARALGVSNCDVRDLQQILEFATVPPAYVQNLFKIYKPGEQIPVEDVVAFAHRNHLVVVGYSVQTEWPHIMVPLQDPHLLTIASHVGRTPSQVLHRWTLQRGVGVIPKSAKRERILENSRLLDFELTDEMMRLLDGLATLSESGASEIKPLQEDVFGLARVSAESAPQVKPNSLGLEDPRDKGFPYAAIRDHLLGDPLALDPDMCRQTCLNEPRCAAWEVCAPISPEAGCGGCYLIGHISTPPMRIPGWHAAVERSPA